MKTKNPQPSNRPAFGNKPSLESRLGAIKKLLWTPKGVIVGGSIQLQNNDCCEHFLSYPS